MKLITIIIALIWTSAAKGYILHTDSPIQYDLMKDLPLGSLSTGLRSSSRPRLGNSIVRPTLEKLAESIRERPTTKLRTHPGSLIDPLRRRPLRTRLNEDDRVARVERAFDRLVNFVDLVGKVDSYISDRAKLAVRKLSAMYSEEERYKRGQ